MAGNRLLIHSIFLFILPILVAALGISTTGAMALVVFALLWRWAISLSAIATPATLPELELETISASHFVEKVRWSLDRLGVEYTEKPVGGTLGAFFLGRTVPLLKFRSGAVRSSIGNSPEILRYLWGRYSAELPVRAAFLEPSRQRLELERKIDRCGVDLQVWIYFHMLPNRGLTLQAWGGNSPSIPGWQKAVLRLAFPVLRFLIRKSFRITPAHHAKAVEHIEALLGEADEMLADGRESLLGGSAINFSDIAFAAIMGLWVQPAGFGGSHGDGVRISPEQFPPALQEETGRWRTAYPRATAFVENLYRSER
jgi:glutathione S-transferase